MGINGTGSRETVLGGSTVILPGEDCPELPVYTEVSAEELLLGAGSTSRYDGLTPLYKRLPHGPHGLGRKAVARHQRARLYGGMAESVYQRGYGATSVAHVIALAGVSRRAFYEQFSNKEECCLRAHDVIVAHARRHVLEAWAGGHGWSDRLHLGCTALLHAAADSRKGTLLVLADAPAIGAAARARMRLADRSFERLPEQALERAGEDPVVSRLSAQAIVGGVRNVLLVRLRERREQELRGSSEELCAWIESYGALAGSGLLTAQGFARSAGRAERARLEISAAGVAPDGALPGLIAAGRPALESEELRGRLGVVLTAALDAATAQLAAASSWPIGVQHALGAYVGVIGAEAELVRRAGAGELEDRAGGEDPLTAAAVELAVLLNDRSPIPRLNAGIVLDALAGALRATLERALPDRRLRSAPGLVDHLAFTVLAPYLGADAALEAIVAARRAHGAI
jgi:AcrR family transcriptional regulator